LRKEDKKEEEKRKKERMRDKLTITIAYIKMMTTPAVTRLTTAIYHLFRF
jgi:hypothetical protein